MPKNLYQTEGAAYVPGCLNALCRFYLQMEKEGWKPGYSTDDFFTGKTINRPTINVNFDEGMWVLPPELSPDSRKGYGFLQPTNWYGAAHNIVGLRIASELGFTVPQVRVARVSKEVPRVWNGIFEYSMFSPIVGSLPSTFFSMLAPDGCGYAENVLCSDESDNRQKQAMTDGLSQVMPLDRFLMLEHPHSRNFILTFDKGNWLTYPTGYLHTEFKHPCSSNDVDSAYIYQPRGLRHEIQPNWPLAEAMAEKIANLPDQTLKSAIEEGASEVPEFRHKQGDYVSASEAFEELKRRRELMPKFIQNLKP